MSAHASLAVVGGKVVTEATVLDATILVDEQGRISGLVAPDVRVTADETVDAAGMLVFPGGVDTHTHFNDPGLTASEDFLTGTSGAAAGGYTTVLEMPQTLPLVDSTEHFADKLATVDPKAVVDFGLYCALVPDNCQRSDVLREISDLGAIGFKSFVCNTPEMATVTGSDLARGMRNVRQLGLPVAVHCESQAIIDLESDRLEEQGAHTVGAVAAAHSLESEEDAVRLVLGLARSSGGAVHLVHMSQPRTVEIAEAAKRAGVDVSIESCPQYFALTVDDMERAGGWGLCFPPLRPRAAVEGMWKALRLGMIDALGSDHCAYKLEEKVTSDPRRVLPGISGVQIALPALVHGALQRSVPLPALARAFCAAPARRFGLYPKKGDIRPGADADLVLVDLQSSITARASDWFTRCPGTVYEGLTYGARVRQTMVRGSTVYVDAEEPAIVVEPGFGEFLHGQKLRSGQVGVHAAV